MVQGVIGMVPWDIGLILEGYRDGPRSYRDGPMGCRVGPMGCTDGLKGMQGWAYRL